MTRKPQRKQSRSLRCLFGFHKWSEWEYASKVSIRHCIRVECDAHWECGPNHYWKLRSWTTGSGQIIVHYEQRCRGCGVSSLETEER
jgi:hypothetical protein